MINYIIVSMTTLSHGRVTADNNVHK